MGWPVSLERTARAFCPWGQGPAHLAANIPGMDGAGTSCLTDWCAGCQSNHAQHGASLPSGCARGPQSRGVWGHFPQRAKLRSFGARGGVGIFLLLGRERVPGVSLLAFISSWVFRYHLHLITRDVWCLESLGPHGLPALCWGWILVGFHLFHSRSLSPLVHVDTSRLLSSPLSFPCHLCHFYSFIIILARLGEGMRRLP